ncbi:serine/threonine-protein kinase [Streptomyces sp. NPDC048550]|uniref:WD40 repeat domain-containing serine/threonine protein kinase n=1 Tax=Streptomyces sp. NPDC048550 TaxID=3155739 RepID=UPI003415C790
MNAGDELGGRYRLSRALGQGGMGEVWAAYDAYLNRQVAIKIVLSSRSTDLQSAERLRREARTAAALKHPGITEVHDFGYHDGAPFFVMELLDGDSLEELLNEHPAGLPAVLAVRLMAQVAEALAYAHNRGVVHRDIKPANLMYLVDGGVKICDFGISRVTEATDGLTLPGSVIGTPAFMAPEQWRGEPADSRADVYAFGVTLHSILTSARPFPGPGLEDYRYQHLNTAPPRLRDRRADLPASLEDLLQRLLAKEHGKRTTTASQVADALHGIHVDLSEGPETRRMPRRRPSRRDVVAGLGFAAIAGLSVTSMLRSNAESASKHSPRESDTTEDPPRDETPVTVHDGGDKATQAVAFSPDGKTLGSVGDDGVARLWKASDKMLKKTFTHKVTNPWAKPIAEVTEFNHQFTGASSAAFSPDGHSLAVGNGDGTVSLWNIATGAETVFPYLNPVLWNSSPSCVAFDAAGGTLASVYASPTVGLWSLDTRTSSATLTADGPGYWVASLVYSPAGGLLAAATGNGNPGNTTSDGLLQLWNPSSRAVIATLARTNTDRNALAFSPGGTTLANLRNDGSIFLWDVRSRESVATLTGPGSGVTCIAFGPRGILASGYSNGTVALWDAKTRKSLTDLSTGTNAKINCVAISPDGKTVSSGGRNLTTWTIK